PHADRDGWAEHGGGRSRAAVARAAAVAAKPTVSGGDSAVGEPRPAPPYPPAPGGTRSPGHARPARCGTPAAGGYTAPPTAQCPDHTRPPGAARGGGAVRCAPAAPRRGFWVVVLPGAHCFAGPSAAAVPPIPGEGGGAPDQRGAFPSHYRHSQ